MVGSVEGVVAGPIRSTCAATDEAIEVIARSAVDTFWPSPWLRSRRLLWCGGEEVLSSSEAPNHPDFMPPNRWGRYSRIIGEGGSENTVLIFQHPP